MSEPHAPTTDPFEGWWATLTWGDLAYYDNVDDIRRLVIRTAKGAWEARDAEIEAARQEGRQQAAAELEALQAAVDAVIARGPFVSDEFASYCIYCGRSNDSYHEEKIKHTKGCTWNRLLDARALRAGRGEPGAGV